MQLPSGMTYYYQEPTALPLINGNGHNYDSNIRIDATGQSGDAGSHPSIRPMHHQTQLAYKTNRPAPIMTALPPYAYPGQSPNSQPYQTGPAMYMLPPQGTPQGAPHPQGMYTPTASPHMQASGPIGGGQQYIFVDPNSMQQFAMSPMAAMTPASTPRSMGQQGACTHKHTNYNTHDTY